MSARRPLVVALVVVAAVGVAGGLAVAVGERGRTRAVFDDQVLDSMDRLLDPSTPPPRAGDTALGDGRYLSEDSCASVQAAFGGTLSTSTFGWVSTVSLPTGDAAVIGGPSEEGCTYDVTNTETIEVLGADAPGFDRFRAFANVACARSPLAGAFAEFSGPDGAPMVLLLAGDVSSVGFGDESAPTSTDPPLGTEQIGSLQLFSGRYSQEGMGMTQLLGLEGTLRDVGNGFAFTAGDVEVRMRCTAVDPAALIPKDAA